MMEILEMVLWIITPMLLFVGLAWLGFILGLLSDPYYGIRDPQDLRHKSRPVVSASSTSLLRSLSSKSAGGFNGGSTHPR